MKAADIPDEAMLAAITRDIAERRTRALGACTWTLAGREGWPTKVAGAKLRKMERRGIVDGCACGCRGDWTIVEACPERTEPLP